MKQKFKKGNKKKKKGNVYNGLNVVIKANHKEWVLGLIELFGHLTPQEAEVLWEQGQGIPPKKPRLEKICEHMNQLMREGKVVYDQRQNRMLSTYHASLLMGHINAPRMQPIIV